MRHLKRVLFWRLAALMLVLPLLATVVVATPTGVSAAGTPIVASWGWGTSGQNGDGTRLDRYLPVTVLGLPAGSVPGPSHGSHSLAVAPDGGVWGWGSNVAGQVGDGTSQNIRTGPVQVSGLSGVAAVAAGYQHSVALKSDGTVWAWGRNAAHQVDSSTAAERHTPVQVGGLSGVTAIAVGFSHNLAIESDGTLWAWGGNTFGVLGQGNTSIFTKPVQVTAISGVTAISAGYAFSLARKSDGTAWAWGADDFGQLGTSAPETCTDSTPCSTSPVRVGSLTAVTSVAAGSEFGLARRNDGSVWAWGYGGEGALGDGTANTRTAPAQVPGLGGATRIAAGSGGALAVVGTLTFAQDSFTRALGGGWGSADIGRAYAVNTPSATLAVDGAQGSMALNAAGAAPWAHLPLVAARDADTTFKASLDALPAGGPAWVAARARIDKQGHTYYQGRVRVDPTGRVFLVALRYSNGVGAYLPTAERLAPVGPLAAGDAVRVRMRVTGANPTTVRLKVWPADQTEPLAFQYVATDTADLRQPGAVGLAAYLDPHATNAPITATFDDLLVRALPPA